MTSIKDFAAKFLVLTGVVIFLTCGTRKVVTGITMKGAAPLDTTAIERIVGIKGKASNGEYKIIVPQNDLSIMVDGFKIKPAMGLGTWVAFTPSKNGAMVMGDIIVTESDLKSVQQEIIRQDLI